MEIQFTTRNKDSHILYHTYITLDNKNKNNISADYVQMSEQVFENTSLGKMPLYLKEQINQAQQIIKQLIINRFEIALANNADFIAKNSILQQLNLEVELFLRFEKTTITKNWTTDNFVNNFKNSSWKNEQNCKDSFKYLYISFYIEELRKLLVIAKHKMQNLLEEVIKNIAYTKQNITLLQNIKEFDNQFLLNIINKYK